MASEPTRTLIDDLDYAAAMLEASPLENTLPLASRLREAAGRLREEMRRTCIVSADGCCSALKRVNGGPLVTSGADQGPKGALDGMPVASRSPQKNRRP